MQPKPIQTRNLLLWLTVLTCFPLLFAAGPTDAVARTAAPACKVNGRSGKTVFSVATVRVVRIRLQKPTQGARYQDYVCSHYRERPAKLGSRHVVGECGSYVGDCPPEGFELNGKFLAFKNDVDAGEGAYGAVVSLFDLARGKAKEFNVDDNAYNLDLAMGPSGRLIVRQGRYVSYYRYRGTKNDDRESDWKELLNSPLYLVRNEDATSADLPAEVSFVDDAATPTLRLVTANGSSDVALTTLLQPIANCTALKKPEAGVTDTAGEIFLSKSGQARVCVRETGSQHDFTIPCKHDPYPPTGTDKTEVVFSAVSAHSIFWSCNRTPDKEPDQTSAELYRTELTTGTSTKIVSGAPPCSTLHPDAKTAAAVVWIDCENVLHAYNLTSGTDQVLDRAGNTGTNGKTVKEVKDLQVADNLISWVRTFAGTKTTESKSQPLTGS